MISLYWKCQVLGWSLASIFWNFNAYRQGGFHVGIASLHFLLDLTIGIGITHAYRNFSHAKRWLQMSQERLVWRVIAAILVTGIAYMIFEFLKNFEMQALFTRNFYLSPGSFFTENVLTLLATGIRLMAIWILAFHLYHYALWQMKITRDNDRLLIATREAQLNNLSAQLNPHFFFNSLNTIKALIASDSMKARRAIDLLSELLRTSLYREKQLITIEEEIGLIYDYFELEAIRFDDQFSFNIQTDPTLESKLILPLSIQTLAENAIKHGISNYKGWGFVSIVITKEPTSTKISVRNTGKLDAVLPSGLGLKNLRNRLSLQYGDAFSLNLDQISDDEVLAVLIISQA